MSGMVEKSLILICSTAVSLLVFNLVKDFKWLRDFGKNSMFHYLYHIFLVSILAVLLTEYNIPTSLPYILLYTAIIVVLLSLFSRVKVLRWLTGPFIKRRTTPQAS